MSLLTRARWAVADFASYLRTSRRSRRSGYAYLLVVFLAAGLMIQSQRVLQNIKTERQRERDKELIWRGRQYIRAIRLYYRKTGHYPQAIDDLQKGLPELHFLRASAYKNPMDKDEGIWRMIYVNGTGQIIGSVRYATLQQMAMMVMNHGQMPQQGAVPGQPGATGQPGQVGVPASSLPGASATTSDTSSQQSGQDASKPPAPKDPCAINSFPAPAAGLPGVPGQPGQNPAVPGAPPANGASPDNTSANNSVSSANGQAAGQNSNSQNQQSSGQPNGLSQGNGFGQPIVQLQPTGPVTGPVLGAFFTGVAPTAGTDNKCSVKGYEGSFNYKSWEFIWNPVLDQLKAQQQQMNAAGGSQPGQNVGAGQAGASTNPTSSPGSSPVGPTQSNPQFGPSPTSNPGSPQQ